MLVGLVVSGVGFVLFRYGKSQQRMPQLAAGLVLMVVPVAISAAVWLAAFGAAVLLALWLALRAGF